MNREIKFRAWCEFPTLNSYYMSGWDEVSEWTMGSGTRRMSDFLKNSEHFTIMQYTGLKDKNGKEIYEGDIVKWSDGDWEGDGNPRIAKVEFNPELSFFAINVDKENGGHKFGFSNFAYKDTEKHLEIMGNIYENPNLLDYENN